MTEPLTQALSNEAAAADLDWLHLWLPEADRVAELGWTTIGALVDGTFVRREVSEALGPSAGRRVRDALESLAAHTDRAGVVDWNGFWIGRGVRLVPDTVPALGGMRDLPVLVPQLVEASVRGLAGRREDADRTWLIIDGRRGLNSKQRTLEELGNKAFGLTRERIRQIEARTEGHLRELFKSLRFAGRSFRFRPTVVAAIRLVVEQVSLNGGTITEHDVFAAAGLSKTSDPRLRRAFVFLLDLLGLERVAFDPAPLPALWVRDGRARTERRRSNASDIHRFLAGEHVDPLSELDLVIELNKRRTRSRLTLDDVRNALMWCPTVERLPDGTLQARFEFVDGRTNQAYRLISEANRPLETKEMAREINARSRVNRKLGSRNLANQLGGDPRLVPIGRSGRWGIKARDGEGAQSILDIMIEALRRSGTPLARTAIYSAVAAVRPVSENSVAIYLTTQSQFVELDDGTWSLAVWPQAKARPKLRRQQKPRQRRKPTLLEQVAAETRRVVEGRRERRIKLGELVDHLVATFSRSRYTIYGYIDRLDFATKTTDPATKDRWVSVADRPAEPTALDRSRVEALIASGEGPILEFKESLRWDVKRQEENLGLQKGVTKSIAAMLNSRGGRLLVGVADDGNVKGIDPDLRLLAKKGGHDPRDVFQQVLANLIATQLGAQQMPLLQIDFVEVGGATVCAFTISPSTAPVYLRDGAAVDFYVRVQNVSRALNVAEAADYIRNHWAATR